jgi:hypothetical protein
MPNAVPDIGIDAPPAFVPLMVTGENEPPSLNEPPSFNDPPPPPAPPLEANTGSERIEIEAASVVVRLPGDVSVLRLAEVAAALRGLSDDAATGRPA